MRIPLLSDHLSDKSALSAGCPAFAASSRNREGWEHSSVPADGRKMSSPPHLTFPSAKSIKHNKYNNLHRQKFSSEKRYLVLPNLVELKHQVKCTNRRAQPV